MHMFLYEFEMERNEIFNHAEDLNRLQLQIFQLPGHLLVLLP